MKKKKIKKKKITYPPIKFIPTWQNLRVLDFMWDENITQNWDEERLKKKRKVEETTVWIKEKYIITNYFSKTK